MNAKERIDCTVALEVPDRIAVGPLLDHFAATYTGTTHAEFMNDGEKRIAAVIKTMNDLGPWDITFGADTAMPTLLKLGIPARTLFPGVDLPENEPHQIDEREVMQAGDYDLLIDEGAESFLSQIRARIYPEMTGDAVAAATETLATEYSRNREQVEAAGAQLAVGGFAMIPFELLSFARGLPALALDVYDRPQKIRESSVILREALTEIGIRMATAVGVPRVFIGMGRAGPATISLGHWEDLVWPSLEYMANTLIAAGITPVLHCDTDWTRALPALRRLPAGKCIMEVDGDTNIFEAKKVLGERMCIMGDVPAAMQAFADKDEVLSYCKRLIREVGKGGGFILSSGCSIPGNAKPENVKALAEAVEEWGWYQGT